MSRSNERIAAGQREIPMASDFRIIENVNGISLLSWKLPADLSAVAGYEVHYNG